MEYLQRLSTLQTLYLEITAQLCNEMNGKADAQEIAQYQLLIAQTRSEIDRIEKMRSYKNSKAKIIKGVV